MSRRRLTRLMQTAHYLSGLMSTDEENTNGSSQTTNSREKWLRPKDLRLGALLHLGHEGSMLNKMNKQNALVHEQVKTMLKGAGMVGDMKGDEDDGVNIGNEYHFQGPSSGKLLPLSIVLAGGLAAAGLYFGLKGTPPSEIGGAIDAILDFGEPEDIPVESPDES